jgi:recombinational DNA repair protein RecT
MKRVDSKTVLKVNLIKYIKISENMQAYIENNKQLSYNKNIKWKKEEKYV